MVLKIIAWNVNGIRSLMKTDNLLKLIENNKPNIICFGEIKISCPFFDLEEDLRRKIKGYKYRYWSPCLIRNGYSGTAIFSKKKPLNITHGIGSSELDQEGRVITLEFKDYYLVHVYTPNSGRGLVRLKYRVNNWDIEFRKYIKNLNKSKPTVVCGDLNVAHKEIDIHNPKGNKKNAGFTNEERNSFDKLLKEVNLADTYRELNPEKEEYSYWTYMHKARAKNKGWRIDYFLVSDKIKNKVKKSEILTDVMGSDHAPIILKIKL
jgi:exodeoxyribonuclease III